MGKIVTFGELMLRLSPENYLRFAQSDRYDATFGGAEANVAAALSCFGQDAAFVTKLPDNEIGGVAINRLRALGVDTSKIVRGGERMGIYFCERGACHRPSNVVYDRAHSAIAQADAADFDWDSIFDDADWFHFSGITPALSDGLSDICLAACKKAKQKNMTVSCDLNYRRKLWQKDKAYTVMRKFCEYVDYWKDVFDDEYPQIEDIDACMDAASGTAKKYGFKGVAVTRREQNERGDASISGVFATAENAYASRSYSVNTVVDRVGAGDAFCAGLIYSIANNFDPQKTAEFAAAASCIKHGIAGDLCLASAAEVEALASGDGGGMIRR